MFHCFYALPALVFSSNKILNGDFSEDFMYWQYYLEDDALADKKVKGSQFTASIEDGGDELWSVILHQGDLKIEYGKQYILRFDARAEEPKFIHAIVQLNRSPWTAYNSNYEFTLGTEMATYERTFTMSSATDNAASLVFELGQSAADVVIDNVFLCELRHSAPQKDLQIQISSEGSTKLTKTPGGSVEIYDTTDGRSVSFSYINNTPVTVEALNNARYSFFRWEIEHEDASISYSYENPLNLVLDEDIVVTSYYNKKAAIEVLYAVNCGGPAYTGSDGISYEADNYYSGGYADGVSGAVPISRTSEEEIYRTERWGIFSYDFPLSVGCSERTLVLKFAELVFSKPGERVFDVEIEGVKRIVSLDIVHMAGANNAYEVMLPVRVTDGELNISFTNPRADQPKVSAILVYQHTQSRCDRFCRR